MKQEFISSIKNGKLQPSVTVQMLKMFQGFEGRKVRISVEKLSSKRSHQQNAYLHLLFHIFTEALNDLGNEFTMIEVKELCKFKFAKTDVMNEKTGEVIGERVKATSEMKKGEMVEFIDSIIRWAADYFKIILPYPNESLTLLFAD